MVVERQGPDGLAMDIVKVVSVPITSSQGPFSLAGGTDVIFRGGRNNRSMGEGLDENSLRSLANE